MNSLNLKKSLLYSDIHYGRKQNSELHNEDCLEFTERIYNHAKDQKNNIDSIIFLGDFFEHRNSLDISTLNYAYRSLELLDSLDIPLIFIEGNHTLFLRNSREITSTVWFNKFKNIIHISKEPITYDNNGQKNIFLPFLFDHEYSKYAADVNACEIAFGHLGFKGFVVTGDTKILEHGPDPDDFSGPKRIYSGHWHKRQSKGNVTYIGSPFPFDFSDANDTERGFATYEYSTDDLEFFNYSEGPSYVRCTLSKLLEDHATILKPKAVVRCLVDVDITMEESIAIKERFVTKYQLREFTLEEAAEDITLTGDVELDEESLETTDEMIKTLLEKLVVEKLDKNKLIKIYENLA